MKFYKQSDGEWVTPKRKGYLLKCCDCGLTHVIDIRLRKRGRGSVVQFRAFRWPK